MGFSSLASLEHTGPFWLATTDLANPELCAGVERAAAAVAAQSRRSRASSQWGRHCHRRGRAVHRVLQLWTSLAAGPPFGELLRRWRAASACPLRRALAELAERAAAARLALAAAQFQKWCQSANQSTWQRRRCPAALASNLAVHRPPPPPLASCSWLGRLLTH